MAELDESASAGHDRIRSASATLLLDCFTQLAVAIWETVNSWSGAERVRMGGRDGPNHGYGDEKFYIVLPVYYR
jgi:hypothetical protein